MLNPPLTEPTAYHLPKQSNANPWRPALNLFKDQTWTIEHDQRLVILNHQSQSFYLRYGSILPTSLIYTVPRPEAFHLGDLMR